MYSQRYVIIDFLEIANEYIDIMHKEVKNILSFMVLYGLDITGIAHKTAINFTRGL